MKVENSFGVSRRAILTGWISAIALAGAGLIVMLVPVEVGDTYCGTALYDTVTAAPCGSTMAWRRIGGALLIAGAVVVVIASAMGGVEPARRGGRLVAGLMVAASMVAVLVVLNRLLQPASEEWCGSLVNRHRTYEPALERRCDDLLASHRTVAMVAGVVAVVASGAGVGLWRWGGGGHKIDTA